MQARTPSRAERAATDFPCPDPKLSFTGIKRLKKKWAGLQYQFFLAIQTNCKRFCSFVGPYINSCGASSDSPRPLAEDPAPRSARRSPAGRGRRAGTRIGAGRGRPSRTLGCRGRRLELPPRPPALPSVAQVGRTAKPARPPARLPLKFCRLCHPADSSRRDRIGPLAPHWGAPGGGPGVCGSRLPGHWQAAGPAGRGDCQCPARNLLRAKLRLFKCPAL